MTDKEIKTAVKYAESWLNTGRECYEGYALERHATQYAKYVVALAQELAALKEKYRWRRQSEEPAPDDEVVEAVYLCEDRKCGPFYANRDGSQLKHCDYWRPLDLPEEGAE